MELVIFIRVEIEVEFSPDAIYATSELYCFVHIWRFCSLAGALGDCLTSAGHRARHRELTFLRANAFGSSCLGLSAQGLSSFAAGGGVRASWHAARGVRPTLLRSEDSGEEAMTNYCSAARSVWRTRELGC